MSAFKKIWNGVTTAAVVVVVVIAILLVGVRLFGLQVFTVLSGSMEPEYPTGSLIYVKKVDARTLDTGDVITFMMNEDTIATHRIAGVVPDEEDPGVIRFRTKGDANEFEDAMLVHYKNVLGTPVFVIPKLGVFAHFIQNPPGRYYAIIIIILLLLLSFLPDLFGDEKDKDKPAKKKKKSKSHDEDFHSEPDPIPEKPKRKKTRPAPASEPVILSEAKNPPDVEKILRRKAPQDDSTTARPHSKHEAARQTPASELVILSEAKNLPESDKILRRKAPQDDKTTAKPHSKHEAPRPVRAARPAPEVEEMTFDLEDILADFHRDNL